MTPFQCNEHMERQVKILRFGCCSRSDPAVERCFQLFSSGIRLLAANMLLQKLNHEIMSCDWAPLLASAVRPGTK